MGAQVNGSLPPGPVEVFVDASAKRDNDTAQWLLEGMGRHEGPSCRTTSDAGLFNPVKHGTSDGGKPRCAGLSQSVSIAALRDRIAANPMDAAELNARLDALQAVLGKGAAPALSAIPNAVGDDGYWSGGLAVASEFTEAFLMQQGNDMEVAWGNATKDDVYEFLKVTAAAAAAAAAAGGDNAVRVERVEKVDE